MSNPLHAREGGLQQLARASDFADLTPAEIELLNSVATGHPAIYGKEDPYDVLNDPSTADQWDDTRRINAALLTWLCSNEAARKNIHRHGIWVEGADIAGTLELEYANLSYQLRLRNCRLKDGVDIKWAELSQLDFAGSLVQWILADGLIVKNSMLLNAGFIARSGVSLQEAQISGDLDCRGGTFSNIEDPALNADRIVVKGGVFLSQQFASNGILRVFTADGIVQFSGAQISGPFNCAEGNFQNATLDLTDASAGRLVDSGLNDNELGDPKPKPTLWPKPGKLRLDGFAYGRIASEGQINVDKRLDWLALQPESPFHPQPYMELAKILREAGNNDGEKRVLIEMEDQARKDDTIGPVVRPLLRLTIGYGHDPLRTFWWAAGLSALGWIVYRRSYLVDAMAPTDEKAREKFKEPGGKLPSDYRPFSPVMYSLENSLPLVKLGQGDAWQPDTELRSGQNQNRSGEDFAYRWAPLWLVGVALVVLFFVAWSRMPHSLHSLGDWIRFMYVTVEGWIRSVLVATVTEVVLRWKWFSLACAVILILIGARWRFPQQFHGRWTAISARTASPRFVMWFLWFQILLGWLLATLFVAGISGIVHKE